MSVRPLITVVTVCRDAEEVVERALRSVAGQVTADSSHYLDYEHIIIDGASRDATLEYVRAYAATQEARDVRVTVRSEPDAGIYDAMNKGLALAEGRFVAFLNADDWYASRALATVAAIVGDVERDSSSLADCIGGTSKIVDVRESTVAVRLPLPAMLERRYPQEMPVQHQALFIRTDLMRELGGFDTTFRVAADYDLCLRLLARDGVRWVFTDRVLSHFTRGGVSSHPVATAREYFAVRRAHGWPPAYALVLRIRNSLAATLRRALPA